MKVLIKLGGTLLDCETSRRRLAAEIGRLCATGAQCVVVHGGGKQMTRFLAERGIESRFVNGLRITTPAVLDAVLKILAGSVNSELVGAFIAAGSRGVGVSGMDALTTEAEPISEELGAVGKPVRSDPALLRLLLAGGYVPVVACVAGDRSGRFYNVNADQMAVAVAAALQVDHLFFLTDVPGVRGNDQKICSALTARECATLIEDQVATGGMRAKLEAAMEALSSGVPQVVIAPGAVEGIVQQLASNHPVGTRLVA